MTKFQVPASKASINQNRFEFELDGKSYSIPKLQYIKPSLMKRLNGQDAEMLVLSLVDEYHEGLSDEFDSLDQMLALYEAWAEASGLTVGESSGSGVSSSSTAEPSTETSSSQVVPSEPVTTTEI